MGVKQASTESSSFTGGDEETTLWNDITTWAQKHSLFADEGVLFFHSIPTFGIRVAILLYSSTYKFNCCSFCSREAPFADQVNPKCSTRHMSNFSSIVRAFFSFFSCYDFMIPHTPAKPIVRLHHIPHRHGDDLRPLSRPGPLHFLLLFASPGNFLFMSGPFPAPFNGPYQGPSARGLTCIVMNSC